MMPRMFFAWLLGLTWAVAGVSFVSSQLALQSPAGFLGQVLEVEAGKPNAQEPYPAPLTPETPEPYPATARATPLIPLVVVAALLVVFVLGIGLRYFLRRSG